MDREMFWAIVFVGAIFLGGISIWVFQSSVEASVYNRETGSSITTWEAMWTNLRVDCGN